MFPVLARMMIPGLLATHVFAAAKVTLTPNTATLRVGQTLQFSAAVTGAPAGAMLSFFVNDVPGGNATVGTITGAGLYTSPAVPNAPNNFVTVRASVMQNNQQLATATARVNLQNPVPVITGTVPSFLRAGPFRLTIHGSGFIPASKVTLPGIALTMESITPTSIVVTGAIADTEYGSALALKVANPSPGAASSNIRVVDVKSWSWPAVPAAMAHTFLTTSSFGPTPATLDRVQLLGLRNFLEEQFAAAPSEFPDTLLRQPLEYSQEQFFRNAMRNPDQLRQRVAFALHKIFVVSGVEVDCAEAYVPYLRLLQQLAFGNFYDILRGVTLLPAMGEYLDMVNNKKGDPATGTMPNENFARELLQLFTIGLVELNPDGSPVLGADGNPVPSYTQADVMEYSRAFTGWTYPDNRPGSPTNLNPPRYVGFMEPVERFHDTGPKYLLRGTVLPPGQTAQQDLDAALQNLFHHPNVGPFIGKLLIQHLTTSNPSPRYIAAVAAAFNGSNGAPRGDMKNVLRAILLDPEASGSMPRAKLREPALYISGMLRALRATVADPPFMADLSAEMSQRVYYPPSVFSYFSPNFRLPGTSVLAPEFQLFTTATAMVRTNFVARLINNGFGGDVRLDFTQLNALAEDPMLLIERVNLLLLGGKMPLSMKQAILQAVQTAPSLKEKTQTALYLTIASPQFQVEH